MSGKAIVAKKWATGKYTKYYYNNAGTNKCKGGKMMFEVSKEDYDFLLEYVDDAEKHIKEQNAGELLDEIEYAILRKGFDKDGCYNEFGHHMQDIHDRVIFSIRENRKKTP